MKTVHDLSRLSWTLTGYNPNYHLLEGSWEFPDPVVQFIDPIPAKVPGSVQGALRQAGLLPDWNVGRNALLVEWVENRDWSFRTILPRDLFGPGDDVVLHCEGLDFAGMVKVAGKPVGCFADANIPHRFVLTPHLPPAGEVAVEIVFQAAALPRWLGQIGHTSRIREQKTRFHYTWDWCPRLVQIGVWDIVRLEISRGARLDAFSCYTTFSTASGTGALLFRGTAADPGRCALRLRLLENDVAVAETSLPAADLSGIFREWAGLPVRRWWPNGSGPQCRYTLEAALVDSDGTTVDRLERSVGFRTVEWRACEGADPAADPWLCVVNGKPVFLWGVNWVPTLPNHADESAERVRLLLSRYRDMGCNAVRLNGCGVLGKESFYELCDELGLLVWQDFTLSSSYIDNAPPQDADSIAALARQAESIVARRQHHPSLLLWCGGNELYAGVTDADGRTRQVPVDPGEPAIAALAKCIRVSDPTRRFLPSTASGPLSTAGLEDLGTGRAWDVHGPWSMVGNADTTRDYWARDDALFRSEVGFQGASPAALIRAYAGDLDLLPISKANDLYKLSAWWIDEARFVEERGRPPATIEEYAEWSQDRQAEWLVVAVRAVRERFPRCGGLLLWMGHDCFPCPINTSVIDFAGEPKKAALALGSLMARIAPEAVLSPSLAGT